MTRRDGRPKFKSAVKETEIDVVTLRWYLPARLAGGNTPARFIELLREHFPETTPRRFGAYEPFRSKPDEDDFSSFHDLWAEELASDGGMFFFASTAPCFGGTVSFSCGRQDSWFPPHCRHAVLISLEFDGRAFEDEFWCAEVETLFVRISRELEAVYGAAYLEPGYTTRLNRIWIPAGRTVSGTDGGQYPFSGDRLIGLFPCASWLMWIGAPYAPLLRPYFDDAQQDGPGFSVRLGDRPRGYHDYAGMFPDIPEEWLVTPSGTPAARIPEF